VRIVVATFDAGGNVPPMLAIARELAARGHEVTVLHEPSQTFEGLPGRPFATPLRDRRPRTRIGTALGLARVFADRRLGREIVAVAHERDADVVVLDCLLVGAARELAASGIRTVSVVHLMYSFLRAATSGPFGLAIRMFGGGRASDALTTPQSVVVTTIREWERDADFPANVRHVGPVEVLPSPASHAEGAPLVVVSLSTTPNPGQERTLQAIADALGTLPVRAVLSGGGLVDPASLRLAPNVEASDWIDHDDLLPRAALLVGHGGHGTTVRALAAGVPVLALPVNALGDQPEVGRALARLGVGGMLPGGASPARIRGAVEALLADAGARARARAFGGRLRAAGGATEAADIVEAGASR
jgi:UDP:flavonoid glycosyltransferase YjiC (YdhE family)